MDTLHEDQYTFLIISCSLRMRNVSDKSCRENQNTRLINFFLNCAIYEIIWKILYSRAGHRRKLGAYIRIACWRPMVMNMVSKYVTLTAFPLQQWLQEHASVLHYTYIACLGAIKVDSAFLTLAYYPLQYSFPC